MQRRQLLVSTITLTTAGLAGCAGDGSGGVAGSGPESVAKSYLQAYFDGNYREARGYTTGIERDEITKQEVAEVAAQVTKIGDVVKKEQSGSEAVVSIIVTVETTLGDSAQTIDLLLVNQSGWKVSHSRTDFEGESKPAEAGAFDSTVEGPIDVVFEYFWAKAEDNVDEEKYLTDSVLEKTIYEISDNKYKLTLNKHTKSNKSSTVVIDHINAYNMQYTFTLTQTNGEWLTNSIDTGEYEDGKYGN